MADNTNLNQVVGNIGKFGTDYSNSMRTASERMRYLQSVATNLGRTSKDVTSAIKDSSEKLSKFNQAISSSANSIAGLTGKSTKFGFAVGAATKSVSSVLTSFLEVADNIIQLNDSTAKFGVGVENSVNDIIGIAHSAGYWSDIQEKFAKQVELAGKDMISLAPTTGAAVKRFGKIFNVSQIKGGALAIMKLGYSPETFNKAQVDYIKLQSAYGLKQERDDNKLRTATMDYAMTIAKLSSLTGESKDAISQQLASQALDFKYQAERRKLVLEGKEKEAKELDNATALINSQLGPDIMKGINDMIANGTATTKEGEGVMLATQNQAAKWAEQVKQGKMSGVEYARNVAKAYSEFIQTNKEALRVSEDFRRKVGVTGKTMTGIDLAVGMADDATVEKLLQDSQNAKDAAKELQAKDYEIRRNANIAKDTLVIASSGLLYDAFEVFANFVKRIAYGAASLGKTISPEGSAAEKAFEKVMEILGTKEDAIATQNKIDKELKETEDEIKKHGKYTEDYIKDSADFHAAQKAKTKLLEQKKKGQKIDEKELEKYTKQEQESWSKILATLEREKKMFGGVTSQTLLTRKRELLEKKKNIEVTIKVKTEEEAQQKQRDKFREEFRTEEKKRQEAEREGKPVVTSEKQDSRGDPSQIKLGKITTRNGLTASVNVNLVDRFQKLINWLEDRNYVIKSIGGYNVRKVAGTNSQSHHSYGAAIDINPKENPMGPTLITDMPEGVGKFAKSIGLGWGGYWDNKKDAMHFSAAKNEGGSGYATGGISKGPKSGYTVELHGTEAIVPLLDGKTIPIELKLPDQKADFTDIKKEITYRFKPLKDIKVPELKSKSSAEPYDDTVEFDLISNLLVKIESMTKQFETSNSIQNNLKLYLSN